MSATNIEPALVGSTRGIRAYFTDANGTPVDPTEVTAWVLPPDDTAVAIEATESAAQDDDVAGATYYEATATIEVEGVHVFYMKGDDDGDDVVCVAYQGIDSHEPDGGS